MLQQSDTYDLAGRLVETRDALNRLTTHAEVFDPATGQTTRTTTSPGGGTTIETRARDGSTLNVRGTAAAPRDFEYGIDAGGVFTREIAIGVDGNGQPTTTEWTKRYTDFAGRASRTVFADNAASQSFYNNIGQLVRQVDPDGVTTLYAYNARGEQETQAVDLNGNNVIDFAGSDRIVRSTRTFATKTDGGAHTVLRTTTQAWETTGQDTPTTVSISEQSVDDRRTWQTVQGLTTTSVIAFDGSGGSTTTTTGPDGVKAVQVSAAGRLLSTRVSTAADVQLSNTTYSYDAHGRLQASTDARNGTTTFTYYGDDQLHTVTTPDPDTTRTGPGYDPQVTTYVYDAAGRVQTVTHPDGGVVSTTYWPTGAVRRASGARTYPTEYTYDPQGRVKTLTTWQDFAGDTGKAVTTWNYDPVRGTLLNKRYADNTGPSYTYTPAGRLRTRTWARTPVLTTTYSYNAAGDLAGTDYSDATPDVSLTYDRSGRAATITDGVGSRTLTYRATRQLENEIYSGGPLNGFIVGRSFDSLHRLNQLSVPSVSSVGYTYDAASRLATVTSGASTATYSYVPNSPLAGSVTFANAGTTRLTTTKVYDNLNRLASITNQPSASGVSPIAYSYAYNAANQRTRVTREDNAYWNYGYDPLGQVTSGRKHQPDATVTAGHDFAWTYDDIGNRRTSTTNGAGATYAPNLLNQYSQRTVPGTIDVAGAAAANATVTVSVNNGTPQSTTRQGERFHRQVTVDNAAAAQTAQLRIVGVTQNAGPNGQDAVTTINQTATLPRTPETFSHDLDGNLLADGKWTYTWDAENRLIALETNTAALGTTVARQRLEFTYDGQSRRIAKKVSNWNGTTWVLASHTVFIYDGWNLLAELNAMNSNAVIRTYAWGLDLSGSLQGAGGVGGLLAVIDAATSATHFAAFDGNGNVGGLVSASTGVLTAKYDYNAFGEVVLSEGTFAAANVFRFSTKYSDIEPGYLYYGFRYYYPGTGRWLSRDPIQERGGVNLYGMIGNNPVNFIDVLGLTTFDELFQMMLGVSFNCRGKSALLDSKFRDISAAMIAKNKPFQKFLEEFGGNAEQFEKIGSKLTGTVGNAIEAREFLQDVFGLKQPHDSMSSQEYAEFIEPINRVIGKVGKVGEYASAGSTLLKGDPVEVSFELLGLLKLPGGDKLIAFGPGYLKAGYQGAKREIRAAALEIYSKDLSAIDAMCDCNPSMAEDAIERFHRSVTRTKLFD